jgi:GT2 family glycosyltransferase
MELQRCLAAVLSQDYGSFDVVVVDNSPTRPASEACRLPGGTYLTEPVVGLSCARNRGARAASGDVVVFTDDDAVPDSGWLVALMREFEDPSVHAVAGRIRYMAIDAERNLTADERDAEHPSRPWRSWSRFDAGSERWFEDACFGRIGDGANMAFRRKVFDSWSGFDERIGRGRQLTGGEDHFAFLSVVSLGHRVVYTPAAVIQHPHPTIPERERARKLEMIRDALAMIVLLWIEHPAHRRDLLRFLGGAVLRRLTGRTRRHLGEARVSAWESCLAVITGPSRYFSVRRTPASPGQIRFQQTSPEIVARKNSLRSA